MRRMKLSVRLPLLIVMTACIVVTAGGLLAVLAVRSSVQRTETEANANSVKAYASAIGFYLNEARSVLEITAQLKEVTEFRSAPLTALPPNELAAATHMPLHNIVASILKESETFEYVMLLSPDGTVSLLEPHELQSTLSRSDLVFATWYKELMSAGQTVVSNLHISPATKRPTIVVATPIRNSEGRIVGIWAGGLNLGTLSQIGLSESRTGPPQRCGYITDRRGLIIAHQAEPKYVQEQTDFSSVPPVQAALSGQQSTMRFRNPIDGIENLGASMPLPGLNWVVVYVVPVKVAFEQVNKLSGYLIGLAILMIIFMGLGALLIARQVTWPLGQLAAAAVTIGTGDLTQRTKVTSGDEIGQLGAEFNRMAVSLSDKEAKLREYATQLEQKVEERTAELARSLDNLKQKSDDLERSNAELERFAYVASHDLQEPLRMVSSYTQLLERRYKDKLDADANDFINFAVDGAKRMQRLINDLLAYSRVGTRGKPFEPTDCQAVVNATIANLDTAIRESDAKVTYDPLPIVMADEGQLVQLFQNLIGNAIKFHDKLIPKVNVSAKLEGDKWVFSVKDNGIGIDPQYFDRVFVIFQRLQGSNYSGTGVGLSISKKIVERHGGRIWIESQPGKGSTFYFTLLK